MSKFKFSSNLFIELAEIEKIKSFLVDDGYKMFLQCLLKNYGIVRLTNVNNPLYYLAPEDGGFKIEAVAGYTDRISVGRGLAIDTKMRLIPKLSPEEFQIPNDGTPRWIYVEYDSHNFEQGTISMTMSGQVTGVGTEFTKILRGYNNFPNKIKVESSNQTFEVVDVVNDTQCFVKNGNLGTTFNNERFSVVGAFTPGFIPNPNNLLIYEYDSSKITIVSSSTPPILNADQYLIGMVEYDANNNLVITDERDEFFNTSTNAVGQISNDLFSMTSTAIVNPPIKLNDNVLNYCLELELNFQFVCNIMGQNIVDPYHQITITQIECNALANTIPSGSDYFKDYWLFNRANGKRCLITSSINTTLNFDAPDDFFTINPDLCILPKNYADKIEIEIKNEGNPSIWWNNGEEGSMYSTHIFSTISRNAKIDIPIMADINNIEFKLFVKYRFVGDNLSYQNFKPIPQINFNNYLRVAEIPDNNGMFKINPSLIINQITENYS